MDGAVNPTADDVLAELVARYEESLAEGFGDVDLDVSSIAGDPDLLQRWQGVKSCLDLMHRVQRVSAIERRPPERAAADFDNALATGFGLPSSLGRFEILRRLGAGGVGLVYLAKDPRLGRLVALKVPRLETLTNPDLRNRFLREAEAAARLSHPNVVPVLETGQDDLLCYIAAEYCQGPTLAEWLRDHAGQVPVQQAATMVRQLSSAVQHAHSRGVLHRDIKPGNVLLVSQAPAGGHSATAPSLVPKLTDFGMAKLLEHQGYDETHTGATIGTPAYMAPEQAAGRVRELDSRTDVYALGAVIYELLTGSPPFRGEAPLDVLRRVLDEDPVPLRRMRQDVPLDLEAICLKCLAKRPAERYQTAQQLADDLDRFLAHEPIHARPPGVLESVWKWARRHPLAMGTAAIAGCALVVLVVVTSIYNSRLSTAIVRADREAETSRQLLYSANVQLAQQSLERNNAAQTLDLLRACIPKPGQTDLREFSWYYLQASCNQQELTLRGHVGGVFGVAYSPDGSTVASVGQDHTVRLWDAASGKPQRVLRGHESEVTCVAFSQASDLLVTGSEDHTVRLWNWRTGAALRVVQALDQHVLAVALSRDGRWLAVGGREPVVKVWNLADDTLAARLDFSESVVQSIQFSPDGARLLAADNESRIHVWNTGDWSSLPGVFRPSEVYFALALSGNAAFIAAAGRREEIEVLTPSDNGFRTVASLPNAHLGWIQSLAFSPDAAILASSGKDGVIRLWSCDDWRVQRALNGHIGRIWSLAWSPDGKYLASAGEDGQVRVWNVGAPHSRTFPVTSQFCGLADSNATDLISCNIDGIVERWSATTFKPKIVGRINSDAILHCELSPDRQWLAASTFLGKLLVVGTDNVTPRWAISTLDSWGAGPVAWSPDNRLLAGTMDRRVIAVFDAGTGRVVNQFNVGATVRSAEFSAKGPLLVSAGDGLYCWDHQNSVVRWKIPGAHHALAVSPDGRCVVSNQDTRISVVDCSTGELLGRLVAEGDVKAIAVSPDNRTIAIGIHGPNRVELWDLATRRQLIAISTPPSLSPNLVRFSQDGRRLYALGTGVDAPAGQILEWAATTPHQSLVD